jgi:hypothetical protein
MHAALRAFTHASPPYRSPLTTPTALLLSWRVRWFYPSLLPFLLLCACRAAPVQWSPPYGAPPEYQYLGPHGRPLAYSGGVCPLQGNHAHGYPPVPKGAFVVENGVANDTRPLFEYFNSHPHHDGHCYLDGWHMHTEPPLKTLVYDVSHGAYVTNDDAKSANAELLDAFVGPHRPTTCTKRACTFTKPHGHRRCR